MLRFFFIPALLVLSSCTLLSKSPYDVEAVDDPLVGTHYVFGRSMIAVEDEHCTRDNFPGLCLYKNSSGYRLKELSGACIDCNKKDQKIRHHRYIEKGTPLEVMGAFTADTPFSLEPPIHFYQLRDGLFNYEVAKYQFDNWTFNRNTRIEESIIEHKEIFDNQGTLPLNVCANGNFTKGQAKHKIESLLEMVSPHDQKPSITSIACPKNNMNKFGAMISFRSFDTYLTFRRYSWAYDIFWFEQLQDRPLLKKTKVRRWSGSD